MTPHQEFLLREMPVGTRVDTPLGRGTVIFRRMKPPSFSQIDSVSVSLDAKSGRWGRHKGAMFDIKDVKLAVDEDPTLDGTDMTVPNTITKQIGNRAFQMLGAKDLMGDENSLMFRIGRNAQGVTHIKVRLDPSDTYTMQFIKKGRAPRYEHKVVSEVDDVYAEDLRRIIELKTGLYTKL